MNHQATRNPAPPKPAKGAFVAAHKGTVVVATRYGGIAVAPELAIKLSGQLQEAAMIAKNHPQKGA